MITRLFSPAMDVMAHQLHTYIKSNIICLYMQNYDTSTVFNHSQILPYMAIQSLKPRSTISLHTDIFNVVVMTIIGCVIVSVKIQQPSFIHLVSLLIYLSHNHIIICNHSI